MPLTTSYNKYLLKRLKDPQMAAAYLNAALRADEPALFLIALRKVAEANGNITKLSRKAKISRVGIYKALSEKGNPGLKTVGNLLSAFHLRLAIQPEQTAHR